MRKKVDSTSMLFRAEVSEKVTPYWLAIAKPLVVEICWGEILLVSVDNYNCAR